MWDNNVNLMSSRILVIEDEARIADFLLRGIDCGALTDDEVASATGLDTRAVMTLAHRAAEAGG